MAGTQASCGGVAQARVRMASCRRRGQSRMDVALAGHPARRPSSGSTSSAGPQVLRDKVMAIDADKPAGIALGDATG